MPTYVDREIVQVNHHSPAVAAARREPFHPEDIDTDHQLDPEDMGETFDAAGIKGIPLDALRQLLLFLIGGKAKKSKWQMATVRLAIISRVLNVDDLGREPLQKLADELGVTRSLLSMRQLQIADGYELGKLRSGKSKAARVAYSVSATNSHIKKGHRMKHTAPR